MHPYRNRPSGRAGAAFCLCLLAVLVARPPAFAGASRSALSRQAALILDGSLAFWWHPAGPSMAAFPQPLPALRLRAGQEGGWSLQALLTGRGAAADLASGDRDWPGGRLELTAMLDPATQVTLSASRGLNYGSLPGPMTLADGRVSARDGWALQGSLRRDDLRVDLLALDGLPVWRPHNRPVFGRGLVVGVQVELPGGRGRFRTGVAGVQLGWVGAGPQWLTFKTLPDVSVQRHIQGVSAYLTAPTPWGEWQAAASTVAWWESDGPLASAGADAAGLVRVRVDDPLPMEIRWSGSGPRFAWPLSRPLSRNRRVWGLAVGPLGDRLHLKAQGQITQDAAGAWVASGLQLDLDLRPQAAVERVEMSVQRRLAASGSERQEVRIGIRSGRERAAVVLAADSGPVWELQTGRWPSPELTVGLRMAPREGSGRLQVGWQPARRTGTGGTPLSARLVYQWRSAGAVPEVRAEWSWRAAPAVEVGALIATVTGASAGSGAVRAGLLVRYGTLRP